MPVSDLAERLTAALADRYAIEREIGAGAMAVVYLARDLKHNRRVAIKVLRPELAAALGAERFLREIETSAQLNHPHILTLIDSGQHDGLLYYVMPYFEGDSLRERLEREPQPPLDQVLRIAREVADALAYAHRLGVIHRDIKPENILLSEGHAVIADFGIAEAIAEAGGARLTATGFIVGSPAYMSPEQASGERALDARSDIYALGCVLYEMLAGEAPHAGDTARAVLARRFSQEPAPMKERRPDVPAPVAELVRRSLAIEPADRFSSAESMREAISGAATAVAVAIGGGGRVAVTDGSLDDRSPAGVERSSRMTLIGGGILVVAMALIVFLMLRRTPEPVAGEASAVPGDPAIAVLPFEVRGAGLEVWREGMVDLLSTNLEGAVGLRPISSRTVLARWKETAGEAESADLETALAVARSTNADYALLGHVISAGSSLRLSAEIYDLSSREVVESVVAEGSPDSVFGLVDELSIEVLETIASDPGIDQPRVDLAGTMTESLVALKHFLAGEAHFRHSDFRAAIADYEEAIAADSLFALAYQRLSLAYGWLEGPLSGGSREALNTATALAERLPPREQLLVQIRFNARANSLDYLEPVRELTRRHPDDAEAWYQLGELYIHAGQNIPVDESDIEAMFSRAVSLQPDFAPYHEHLVDLAFYRGDSAAAAEAIENLERASGNPARSRLSMALAFGDSASRRAALAALDTIPADGVIELMVELAHPRYWPSFEAVMLGAYERSDRLSITGFTPEAFRRLGLGFVSRAAGVGAGRVRDALKYLDYPEVDPAERACEAYTMHAVGLPVPEADLERFLAATPEVPGAWLLCTGGYAAEQGQWTEHQAAIEALTSAADGALEAGDSVTARYLEARAHVLEGYGLLSRGEPAAAIPILEASYADASPPLSRERLPRWWLAEAYLEAGRPADAVPFLRSFWIPPVGVAWYHLGQTYERLGDPATAIAAYAEFLEAWQYADPAVRYLAEDARARIEALETQTG
jgi:tetratricopeptide (TPR) repeat protein/tRNA A-37 threonylcarbamoyl transferase component Bud32